DRFYELLPAAELHNLYGPTEAAIDVSHWPCDPESDRLTVPLGHPIANIQLHVLDPHLRPVPVGVPGELHIGGVGLARGYLQRPGLTAEKFIPDPCSDRPGARLYKTGDLVRYLPTGVLEFLGRIDFQVKVRGLRIELGEIEANLLQHPSVREAIVTVQVAPSGAQQLVAYGVLEADVEALTLPEVRAWLQPKLPEYMVPGAFVLLEQFPLTPSGKVDRRALPAPAREISEIADYELPQTATERELAEIWAEVLGRSSVGIDDNFFELGGDSILSLLMVSRATKAGIQLTPKQLFQHQTIRTLARVAGMVVGIQAEQGPVTGDMPLLPIQEWFFAQALPQPHHWNQAILLQTSQSLAFADLQQVVEQLLQHHDGLRSHFSQAESDWQQTIPATLDVIPCQEIDLANLSVEAQTTAIAETVAQLQGSFDLSAGPLLKVALFRMGSQ
ncbi:MAG: condensation domain-containing protein, partial [Cyanobacteria bacterium J06641_5]